MDEINYIDEINNQFEEYQKKLTKIEKKIRYNTHIEVDDEFFDLLNSLSPEITLEDIK